MYLSKLEILGFKSFAQKTKLKFSDGICCVIGPNGSGKSNIVDAIRWVLGEQKITSLRTDKMESLIFNGTNTRKPLGMTEVSLTVHNNKNILKSTFTDVVISRRLYRSGESHYLVNKAPCRLKDIQDLFMDTGMGANSYSVIELKMVESIISESPSDRRHLFEEAAGVTKYKVRRKSALRKLEMTHQDMSRISDLISEINRNVDSLSRQVGKARRYLKYQEELKQKEIELARFRFTRLMDEIHPLQRQLDEISLIKDDTSHQITLEETLLEDYKREIIHSENQLAEINKQLHDQDTLIHEIKEQSAVAQTRIQSLNETERHYQQDIQGYKEKIQNVHQNLTHNRKRLDSLQTDLDKFRQQYQKKNTLLRQQESDLEDTKKELDHLNEQVKQIQQEVSSQRYLSQEKSYQIQILEGQIADYKAEQEKASHRGKDIHLQLKTITQNKSDIEKDLAAAITKIASSENSIQQLNQDIEQLKEKIQHIEAEKKSKVARIQFFEQIISNYEGFAQSTRHIMVNRKDYPGLHGPLSDLIGVDEAFSIAVETALGEANNYLVVDNVKAAKHIIESVSLANQGRVTLLPMDRLNDIMIQDNSMDFHLPILANLISCDTKYKKIFKLLLGDVAVVENLEQALNESINFPRMRFVTRNGEMLDTKSIITGGKMIHAQASLIGRHKQLEKLRIELENIGHEIEINHRELELLLDKRMDHLKQIEDTGKIRDKFSTHLIEIEKKESQIRYEKDTLEATTSRSQGTIKQTKESIQQLADLLEKIQENLAIRMENLKQEEKQTTLVKQKFDQKNDVFQTLSKELQALNLQLITKENQYKNSQDNIERMEQELSELDALIKKKSDEIEDIYRQVKQIDSENEKRKQNQVLIWEKRDKLEADKDNIQQNYHQIRDKILHLENQIKKYRKQHDSSLERTQQLELNIQENQMKADAVLNRIQEEYNEDISVGISYDGLDIEAIEQQIESLKFRIKQMGQVNPLAVSEYDKESERLKFYTNQFNDLEEAEKSLRKTINKINITARKKFIHTFAEIRKNFQRVFQSFFENGEGTLKLEEDSDPLESNIEILVRPKGKRLQTINLLSGGEKTLTAISLLFAIYLVKPSPFCILDEIDAPLDDVNITRFTEALKEFSKDTQFIVVTHNKRTMEAANTMFGVTMEEEGLSKLVSVKFN